jgi:UPF0716 family protein affecting phage T7 exclusion
MSGVLRGVRAFVMFWVDFIIGDDWTIAATVALALLGTWDLTRAGVVAWWLLPLAVLAVTAVSLRRAVGRELIANAAKAQHQGAGSPSRQRLWPSFRTRSSTRS